MQYLYRVIEPDGNGDYRWHPVTYRDRKDAAEMAERSKGVVVTPNEVLAAVLFYRKKNHHEPDSCG